jgi:hypothetical protein
VLEARLYASQSRFEFRTLSLLLVIVLVQALEEITNQGRDLVSRFIQCEMSRFQMSRLAENLEFVETVWPKYVKD